MARRREKAYASGGREPGKLDVRAGMAEAKQLVDESRREPAYKGGGKSKDHSSPKPYWKA
jgi:hypothetical protein